VDFFQKLFDSIKAYVDNHNLARNTEIRLLKPVYLMPFYKCYQKEKLYRQIRIIRGMAIIRWLRLP
jgi:hypothetical protein